ncbi:MAG: hypothetical protein EOP42_19575 [Sphingobacteriaceae bacterium]|nr:MAG: hypothetical protein EOP42_19575 [Sphingobacteriaceae bacterium]
MIKKPKIFFLPILLLLCFSVNSCKKNDLVSLNDFLTRQPWKLALKQRLAYVNNALVKTDTLENACKLTQTLTFNNNGNYTYQNYTCAPGSINAAWSFTSDYLYLNLNSIISINSAKSQNVARIINLGQYSLVFDAGDVNTVHKTTDSVIIFRYGFIH